MNTPGIPDMQGQAIAPNQEGANGVPLAAGAQSPPGAVPGAPNMPMQSAAAGMVQPMRG